MGLFNCCIKNQLTAEDTGRVSHGTDALPLPQVAQQTTQTDVELLADLLSSHAAQEMHQSSSGSVSMAKEGAAGEGQTNSPFQPQEVPSHGSVPDVGPSRCMSALEMKKLHRGVSGRFTDDTQTQDAEHGLKKQQDVDKAVLRVFLEYARFGTRDKKARTLDVYRFMKLIRECSLMTSPDSAAAVDLIFCKGHTFCAVCEGSPQARGALPSALPSAPPRQPGSPANPYVMYSKCRHVKGSRMDFARFQQALQQIAELLGVPESDMRRAVATSRGPLVNAVTLPRFVRLHDESRADSEKAAVPASKAAGAGCVVERAPGTYPKGMIKAGSTKHGTSGFTPVSGARPGSPCFAAIGAS